MTAVGGLAVVGLALLSLEGLSWVLTGLAERLFSWHIPRRRKFLGDQSRMLDRLIHTPSLRERIHPVLGWEYRPRYASETDHLNACGLRALGEYGPQAPSGVKRIAAFGDSYVYCNEVGDAESWPALIEAGWRAEVLNYGVGGYGADQAFLRYREEGARFHPHVVLMGFTAMMVPRVVNRYRRFQDPRDGPWFKPRFVLDGEGLRLIPAPVASQQDAERLLAGPASVAEFGRHDFWYDPAVFERFWYDWSATYRLLECGWRGIGRRFWHADRLYRGGVLNPTSESFRLLTRITGDFAAAVRARGAEPMVLLLPARSDVERYAHTGRASYDSLRARLEGLGLAVLDVARALVGSHTPTAELFAPGGHYSAMGNAVVARGLAQVLNLSPRS